MRVLYNEDGTVVLISDDDQKVLAVDVSLDGQVKEHGRGGTLVQDRAVDAPELLDYLTERGRTVWWLIETIRKFSAE